MPSSLLFSDDLPGIIVGIDAANLRRGGGVTHLAELLRAADPEKHGVANVVLWGGHKTLEFIDNRPWLAKSSPSALNGGLVRRAAWQRFELTRNARSVGCDLVFAPGGSYTASFTPAVTMSRNMLPFEWQELRRYRWSLTTMKFMLLRSVQIRSFRRVQGLIFLTQYAHSLVMKTIGGTAARVATIPHGIDERFFLDNEFCNCRKTLAHQNRAIRIIYVSIVDVYKHQWKVVEAVSALRLQGYNLQLELIGPAYPPSLKRLKRSIAQHDPGGEFVRYTGEVHHADLHRHYLESDICVFASSCENMPNILLEGMASGLPVACSSRGPMPEILGDCGVYFDPEDCREIAKAIRGLVEDHRARRALGDAAKKRARAYSWQRCADSTFRFLSDVALSYRARRLEQQPIC